MDMIYPEIGMSWFFWQIRDKHEHELDVAEKDYAIVYFHEK